MKTDLYQNVTDQIVSSLEQGVRPWMKPWNAEHAAGRITRPLRANGIAYQGINVLVLWSESVTKGYSAPIWMTFRQALELNAHVRKGECGSMVVYASTFTRSGTDQETGEETEQAVPFLNPIPCSMSSRSKDCPRISTRWPNHGLTRCNALNAPKRSLPAPKPISATAATWPITISAPTSCKCRPSKRSAMPKAITPR